LSDNYYYSTDSTFRRCDTLFITPIIIIIIISYYYWFSNRTVYIYIYLFIYHRRHIWAEGEEAMKYNEGTYIADIISCLFKGFTYGNGKMRLKKRWYIFNCFNININIVLSMLRDIVSKLLYMYFTPSCRVLDSRCLAKRQT
jgi:hypothetical protein